VRHLVHDALEVVTDLVEEVHVGTGRRWARRLGAVEPLGVATEAVVGSQQLVYETIRLVNRGLAALGDAAEALVPPPAAPASRPSRWRDAAQSALNGLYGDFLEARGNGLAIRMALRHDGHELPVEREALARALPAATGRLCLFVHGLGCTEREWSFRATDGESYGTRLARDLGITSLYLRYNTGRPILANGRELAALLAALVRAFPTPVAELALVGHSMGGLVVTSAAHHGAEAGAAWVPLLRHVVCIGSPHLGAPLEKGVHLLAELLRSFEAPGAQVPARILDGRSSGIRDLRHGCDVPFVDGARYAFIASSVTRDPGHPLGRLVGDLMVRLPSAAGRFRLGRVLGGINHVELSNHPEVYAALRDWLSGVSP
jgi:pimeloyl-ACP methyl ester carboxylesterase